jgi:replicative DNA helicase
MYIPERDLLVLLLSKEAFNNYYESIDQLYIKDNYRELYHVYNALAQAHAKTEEDLTLSSLQAFFFQRYPDVDKEIYLALFKTLSEASIDPSLGLSMLSDMKARKQALKLSEAAFNYSNGNGTLEDIGKQYEYFNGQDTKEEADELFVTTSLSSIINDIFQKPGLRWRLNALNKSLGSLRKGNFGFLFARPEAGKTTFLASEVSFMLSQLRDDHGPIIWFNNEQVGAEVMLRFYQGYFGVRLEQLRASYAMYEARFNEEVGGRFLLVDNATITKQDVERICKRFKPSLIIFDQIDKIKGFDADRDDLLLGSIYIWAREIAKSYCPVIGICQADGTGEGVKWLNMGHVANAKTSKQAEADWILGMGMQHGEGQANIRYFNISKNKLMGDEDTLSKLRHGKFEVLIQAEVARFVDIINYE